MNKPFRYTMTDSNKDSLINRIEDAKKRGFQQVSEIHSNGHRPMIHHIRVSGKKRHEVVHTDMKFCVVMEKKEVA